MLKLKTLLTPIALSLALVVAIPAIAKKDRDHNRDGMRQILSQLSLTDVQKQDIREIMKQSRQDGRVFKEDTSTFRSEIQTLIQSNEWDQSAIESALAQSQSVQTDKMLQRATQKNLVWNALTTEQQTKFASLVAENNENLESKDSTTKGKHKCKYGMFKKLALTDEQKAGIKTIREQARESDKNIRAKLKEFKKAERALITSSDFSSEDWLALSAEYQSDFVAMSVSKANVRHDVWNMLTAEQQQKVTERIEKMQDRKKHGKKHKKQQTV
ncbi:Spy/CpxP family protein refolding chaperone [Paraglaciecola sp.]|uniref:Spy/CpxP family protein refolding chaperone n=1 Tax=Paraglaciecola sp. TaxID=1920173 RepID=UPI00326496B3